MVVLDLPPHDGMCHHRVGSYEDDGVGQLQVLQRISGSVKTVALFMCNHCCGHTETGIAVHVCLQIVAHHMAEQCEFLHGKLSGADACHALRSVFCLELFELVSYILKALLPGHFLHGPVRLSDLRQRRRLFHCELLVQRQPFDTAESVIDRIAFCGDNLHDPVVLHIKIQITVYGTVIAGGLYFLHDFLLFS